MAHINCPLLKGIILAAGKGSRLMPITEKIPKPLIPFCGIPILYLAISKLIDINIKHIAVNAHHLSDMIDKACKSSPFDIDFHVSKEKSLLGSGGVYGQLKQWIDKSDVIAINGDIISNFSIAKLLDNHYNVKKKINVVASLGLVKGKNPSGSSVWIDQNGFIASISKEHPKDADQHYSPHIFSGIQIIDNMLIKDIPAGRPSNIIEIYQEELSKGSVICGFYQDCFWHDLGTPTGYFQAHSQFIDEFLKNGDHSIIKEIGMTTCSCAMNYPIKISYDHKQDITPFEKKYDQHKNYASIEIIENRLLPFNAIGPNLFCGSCRIDDSSIIGPYCFIQSGCNIMENTTISNSILLEHENTSISGIYENVVITSTHKVPIT
ncbi:MAG: NDP-sugar synthase [Bdellovibrionota bacterium]